MSKNGDIVRAGSKKFKSAVAKSMPALGGVIRTDSVDNFRREAFHKGTGYQKWKPLSKKYKAEKDIKHSDKKILQRKGKLRVSVRNLKVTKNSVTVGSTLDYAVKHNDGTNGMPKRRFLGESKILIKRINSELNRRLTNLN